MILMSGKGGLEIRNSGQRVYVDTVRLDTYVTRSSNIFIKTFEHFGEGQVTYIRHYKDPLIGRIYGWRL